MLVSIFTKCAFQSHPKRGNSWPTAVLQLSSLILLEKLLKKSMFFLYSKNLFLFSISQKDTYPPYFKFLQGVSNVFNLSIIYITGDVTLTKSRNTFEFTKKFVWMCILVCFYWNVLNKTPCSIEICEFVWPEMSTFLRFLLDL